MDDRLKQLMQKLGDAINDSLSESESIAAAVDEIKAAGYDVFLVLEVTIGVNKIDEDQEGQDIYGDAKTDEEAKQKTSGQPSSIKFTKKDEDYLGEMKISLRDNGNDKDKKKKKKN